MPINIQSEALSTKITVVANGGPYKASIMASSKQIMEDTGVEDSEEEEEDIYGDEDEEAMMEEEEEDEEEEE